MVGYWVPKFLNLKIFIRKRKDGEHCFSIDLQVSLISFSLSISTSVLSTPVTGAGARASHLLGRYSTMEVIQSLYRF